MTDQGARWDISQRRNRPFVAAQLGPQGYTDREPWHLPMWRYERALQREQRIADACMVEFGTILAQRQFDARYDIDKITDAMRQVRKHG